MLNQSKCRAGSQGCGSPSDTWHLALTRADVVHLSRELDSADESALRGYRVQIRDLLTLPYSLQVDVFSSSLPTCGTQRSIFCKGNVLSLPCHHPELDLAERSSIFIFHILFPVFSSAYGKTHHTILCIGSSLVLRRINYS